MENQANHARAALDVLTALQGGPATAAEVRRDVAPAAAHEAAPTAGPATGAATGPTHSAPSPAPEELQTRPSSWGRHVTGLLLLFTLAATGTAAWGALTARDTTLGGLALILGGLTAGLWFLRVVSVPTTVSLLGPRLEVTQGGRHHVWDLASPYSPVDHVRGRPGRPGWRVVLRNADGSTFAIDGSMVPPKRFTEILSRYRPEL